MDIELQRGVTQIVSGVCWLLFGGLLAFRSFTKHRFDWPMRWHLLSGLAMFFAGYSQIAHGFYWLDAGDHTLWDWHLVLPLWLQMIFAVWAFYRWVRDPDETTDKEQAQIDEDEEEEGIDVSAEGDETEATVRDGPLDPG